MLGCRGWDSPMPFPVLVERYQLSRWKGFCHSPSHSSAQLINRRCQTNKLFLLPIDSNLLASGEPRIIYPTCHPCTAAALTSALLPSPLLPIHLWGRAGHTHGAHSALHHCLLHPGMQLQPGLLLLLGMADILLTAAQGEKLSAHCCGTPACLGFSIIQGFPGSCQPIPLPSTTRKGVGTSSGYLSIQAPSPGHAHRDNSRISLLSQREATAAHASAFDACLLCRRLIKA